MADKTDDKQQERPFLSRWSARKRTAGAASPAPELDDDAQHEEAPSEEAPIEMSEEEIEETLAEIEQMQQGDDFKPLIKSTMPEAVRRAALRRLWRSNPLFGFRDGLNDYDLDYTNAATVVENLKTAYKVGKGYLTGEEGEQKATEAAESTAEEVAEAATEEESKEFDETAEQADEFSDESAPQEAERGNVADDGQVVLSQSENGTEAKPLEGAFQSEKIKAEQALNSGRAAAKRWDRFKTGSE